MDLFYMIFRRRHNQIESRDKRPKEPFSLNAEGVIPVMALNWPLKCATLEYPSASAICERVSSPYDSNSLARSIR